ncbi:MAG: protoporphyrinogen oxidase HemJ [Candidatus Portiera sp.]|nr:protoporphyrinogen oxidase HemJ [Portiera sp.]
MLYLTLKSLHIIAMVAWFAGLFYLPRLLAYHAGSKSSEVKQQLEIMQKRLYKIIMNNALMLVVVLGFSLLWANHSVASSGWFHIKLLLVFVLVVYHIMCGRYMRALAAGTNKHSPKFFRLFGEIPTVLLISIVCLAIIKPF